MRPIEVTRDGQFANRAARLSAASVVRRRRAHPLALLVLATSFLFAAFLVVMLGSYFIPYLPQPAGPLAVGTVIWSPNQTSAGSLPFGADDCPVSVQLWYPAEPRTGERLAPYGSPGAGFLTASALLRTGATLDALLSSHSKRYPVLLSLPGWGGLRNENTTFVQDLASRGFIVAGIGYDDPACAGVAHAAGEAVSTDMDFSTQAAAERTFVVAREKIERVAKAASQVIDALGSLDRIGLNGRFNGRLDLKRLGVVGYSLGGAIAMQLCAQDSRLKAAVNIDGWFFDAAGTGWIEQPIMIVSDDSPLPTAADLSDPDPSHRYPSLLDAASDRRMIGGFEKNGGVLVTVLNSKHQDFSDVAYLSRLALLRGRRPDGAAIRTAVDYSAAFFGQVMNGEASSLFDNPPASVRLRTWRRLRGQEAAK